MALRGRGSPWHRTGAICTNWAMTNCSLPGLKNCSIIIATVISYVVHMCLCTCVFLCSTSFVTWWMDQWHFSCLQPKWFEAIMIAWPWNALFKCLSFFSLPVHRFSVNVEPGTKLESGPASLHLCNNLLVLTRGLPPVVVGHWKLSALRRYGAVPNGFVFEGGTRCGYCKYLVDWEALIYLALQPAPRNETLWHYQVKNHHSQCRTTSRPLMLLFVMF